MRKVLSITAMIVFTVSFMSCIDFSSGEYNKAISLFPIRENRKWGFIDSYGEIIIQPVFDAVSPYINGYSAVNENGRWGIINSCGEKILPSLYEIEWENNCSVMLIKDEKDSCGLFYTMNGSFSGLIWKYVKISENASVFPVQSLDDGMWGYVNDEGDSIVDCIFFNADLFHEGWAGVELNFEKNRWYSYDALMNVEGELLLPPNGYTIMNWDGVSDGLIQIQSKKTGKTGYMNVQGIVELEPQWDNAYAFHNGIAAVENFDPEEIYFINRTGESIEKNIIIPPPEGDDDNTSFSFGIMTVSVCAGEKTVLAAMDENGDIIYTVDNESIDWIFHYFDADHAWYMNDHYQYGIINRAGELVTDAEFACLNENGSPFAEGLAPVAKNGLWGYIDEEGNWIIHPAWESAYGFTEGLAMVEYDNMIAYINREGKIVWKEEN